MSYSHHERLSALDTSFLDIEDQFANAHMHVGSVSLFDAAPLRDADGATDIDKICRLVQAGIHRVPRYQQKLARIPVFGNPVWVDDDTFNLLYHIRHVRLPQPGTERQLKRLAGRIMSQRLDRGKPLWELWVVDGLEGDRVALISKAHHCMIDGVGSVELSTALIGARDDIEEKIANPPAFQTRPAPSSSALFLNEFNRRIAQPVSAMRTAGSALRNPVRALQSLGDSFGTAGEGLRAALTSASPTPLNDEVGPHRRFDWLTMSLDEIKAVKRQLGGTINDVVLTVASGALGRFLHDRGVRVQDLDFRAMLPVNVRSDDERESLGNRVSSMMAQLPLAERDPVKRLQLVMQNTGRLKRSGQAAGIKMLEELSDSSIGGLLSILTRLYAMQRPFNVVITNVPGPQFQLYFLGSPLRAAYPLVPLFHNQTVGIALFSYNGTLFWGFNADWDAVPNLHDLVEGVAKEFAHLKAAAAAELPAQPQMVTSTRAEAKPVGRRRRRHTG
jgi:diacylglycerol O-acyltransferase / wax synthase